VAVYTAENSADIKRVSVAEKVSLAEMRLPVTAKL